MKKISDKWNSGDSYEYFMGRWSSLMAPVFLKWLSLPNNLCWLDIGCGTGALSEAIIQLCSPSKLLGIDPSEEFLEKAKRKLPEFVDLRIGNATQLPITDGKFDIVVSGLALNFFPDLQTALSEMGRVTKLNGIISAYVWDYAGHMEFLRHFWNAAVKVAPLCFNLDEGVRFPVCNTDNLKAVFQQAGLSNIETALLDIETIFSDFEDYWNPFLGSQGPAPSFLASLPIYLQSELKNRVYNHLPIEPDGTIKLIARAIAIRGTS